jgi:homoserine kinase type II
VSVYVLWHTHDRGDDDEDVKFIGVFSTEESGRKAMEQLLQQPGFSSAPEGFCLEAHELDEVQWAEGYVTIPRSNP